MDTIDTILKSPDGRQSLFIADINKTLSHLSPEIQSAFIKKGFDSLKDLLTVNEGLILENVKNAAELAEQTINKVSMQFKTEAPLFPFADLKIGQFEVSEVEVDNFSPTPVVDANTSSDIQLS